MTEESAADLEYKAEVGALWTVARKFAYRMLESRDIAPPEPIPTWDDLPEYDKLSFHGHFARGVLGAMGAGVVQMTQPPNAMASLVQSIMTYRDQHGLEPLDGPPLPEVDEPPC